MDKKMLAWMLVIVVALGGLWWWRRNNSSDLMMEELGKQEVSLPTGMEETMEKMGVEMNSSADKSDLKPVDGGNGVGVASVEKTGGSYIHMVIADLPEPDGFYEGWLVNSAGDVLYTGKLEERKGGWILEYRTDEDISDYKKVIVTLEKVDDGKPEEHILEGVL